MFLSRLRHLLVQFDKTAQATAFRINKTLSKLAVFVGYDVQMNAQIQGQGIRSLQKNTNRKKKQNFKSKLAQNVSGLATWQKLTISFI